MALFSAAEKNDNAEILRLLQEGAHIDAQRGVMQHGLLHLWTTLNRPSMVSFLLDHGAYVNLADKYSRIPLHFAVALGKIETVVLLFDRGANVNAVTSTLQSPLHFAVYNRASIEMVNILLDRGANIEAVGYRGERPLHNAISKIMTDSEESMDYRRQIVQLLVRRGADVNSRIDNGCSPLHLGIGDVDNVRILLENHADANAKDFNTLQTPLHYAWHLPTFWSSNCYSTKEPK